jgi:hypothetical protein
MQRLLLRQRLNGLVRDFHPIVRRSDATREQHQQQAQPNQTIHFTSSQRLLHVPTASDQSLARLFFAATPKRRHDAARPGAQFGIGRFHIHHQIADDLAEPNHRDRCQHVEHELRGRPRLEPRRAGDYLRPRAEQQRCAWCAAVWRRKTQEKGLGARRFASSSAPSTNGVEPLAAMPTTTSRLPTPRIPTASHARLPIVFGALHGLYAGPLRRRR